MSAGLTLDAGALTALEKADRSVIALVATAVRSGGAVAIPAGALAQAWRDPARQVLVGSPEVEVVPLDARRAKEAGALCGLRGTSDVVDASVVLCARARRHRVLTSDVDDLRRLDPLVVLLRA